MVAEGAGRTAAEQAGRIRSAMAYNFLACDRDQAFLLPPYVRDWLPADHLAWFVVDVVEQLDLHPFLAAYEPRMLLGVLYAYCTGIRSAAQIERRCRGQPDPYHGATTRDHQCPHW